MKSIKQPTEHVTARVNTLLRESEQQKLPRDGHSLRKEAFHVLYKEYVSSVVRTVYRYLHRRYAAMEWEDAIATVFESIWKTISKPYNAATEVQDWRTYIQVTAKNEAFSRNKKLRKQEKLLNEALQMYQAQQGSEPLLPSLLRLETLPLSEMEVVLVQRCLVNGYTLNDVAQELQIPLGTLKGKASALKRRLREHLVDYLTRSLSTKV